MTIAQKGSSIISLKLFCGVLFACVSFLITSCNNTNNTSNNLKNSSDFNTPNSKVTLNLINKMKMNQLSAVGGYKVAVKVKDGEDVSDLIDPKKIRYKATNLVNAVFVDLDKESILKLAKDDRVEVIEENYDVKVNLLYSTKQIGVRDIWEASPSYIGSTLPNSSNKIRLAVVDTGIDESHSDFNGRIFKKINCYQTQACTETGESYKDDHSHGTHVAGIVLGDGSSYDDGNGQAYIEIHGYLNPLASASRYFFPAQFNELAGSDNIFSEMTWTANTSSASSMGIQSKSDAELQNSNFLYGPYSDSINSGPGVAPGSFIQSPDYSVLPSPGTLLLPHAFLPYTTDTNASGKEFWARVATVVQGWPSTSEDPTKRTAGVSYGSELVAVKSLGSTGTGSIDDIVRSLEYVSNNARSYNIMAVNLSFSMGNGVTSDILKAAARTLVSQGVSVVVSAGNDQQQGTSISSPGDEPSVITVGAVNDQNQTTAYSSVGSVSSTITKPDVLAPGGSYVTRNYIMAPKSRYADTSPWKTPDVLKDSYALKIGTSQATPFITGLIGVMASKKQLSPSMYKMLICMSSFETGSRESNNVFMNAPVFPERAGGLKDRVEGYGRIDARGAMSALDEAISATNISNSLFSFGAKIYEQKTVVRAVSLSSDEEYNFTMTVPSGADYDLYLFSGTPDANGEPLMLASSALINNPIERIVDFVPPETGTYYLVAKWISGSGPSNFALESERTKPAVQTQISDFRIDRYMRDKKIIVSWKTNVPTASKIQYGSIGGLGSELSENDYLTEHSFSFNIDYNNYYYIRGLASSNEDTELDISTAVTPVYRTSTYGELEKNISVEDLPAIPNVGGCGTINNFSSGFNSKDFGAIITMFFPLVFLLVIRKKRNFYYGDNNI
ncbi:MAG: S8 family serine peptidase [bacterium]